ncbi:MAG: RNA polymerase sigma factor [Proteobacteria bacterium]|nr:RNA polymerase sigma factor [Pseudomonadota bacterium]
MIQSGPQPGHDKDLRLMLRVAAGDREAQRVLALRLVGRVHRLSRRLMANASEAEDAAQTALIQILRAAGTFRHESSLERWADRIAARTILRHARAQRRKAGVVVPLLDPENLPHSGAELRIERQGVFRSVEQHMRLLTPAQREALVLKHALGYTTEEIAELAERPVGTIKDRLVNGRRRLRKLLQRELVAAARRAEATG